MKTIKPPTKSFVESFLKSRNSSQYFGAESALKKLFQKFPKNVEFDEVLLKVTCLNDLYKTRIIGTYRVAAEIHKLGIDHKLITGDISVVTDIDSTKPNNRSVYSFATKYCSWHNNEAFPIYDQFAGKLLFHYLESDGKDDIYKYQMRSYSTYVSKILWLQRRYKLESIGIKKLDKFLWLYGKEHFEKTRT